MLNLLLLLKSLFAFVRLQPLLAILFILLLFSGCALVDKDKAAKNESVTEGLSKGINYGDARIVSLGQLSPDIDSQTPIIWSNALSNKGLDATVNKFIVDQLNKKDISGLKQYADTDVLAVSPRYQLAYFLSVGDIATGDIKLFNFNYPGVNGKFVRENRDTGILVFVDIMERRLIWSGRLELIKATNNQIKESNMPSKTYHLKKMEYMLLQLINGIKIN